MHITKKMTDKQRFSQPFHYFRRGRDAFEHVLKRPETRGRKILLPAYIGYGAAEGSGVFDPVQRSGKEFRFYRMKGRLEIDVASLKRCLEANPGSVLLLIHYFGFKDARLARVKKLAAKHDCLVVEDFAHGLFTFLRDPVVDFDWGVFSLHKMLPYPNRVGGMLLSREDPGLGDEYTAFHRYDLEGIARQRCANYEAALERLGNVAPANLEVLRPELGVNVPESFPVLLPDRHLRNRMHARMNEEGFGLISLYHELIAPVDESYRAELRISDRITNLPIHQDADTSGNVVFRMKAPNEKISGDDWANSCESVYEGWATSVTGAASSTVVLEGTGCQCKAILGLGNVNIAGTTALNGGIKLQFDATAEIALASIFTNNTFPVSKGVTFSTSLHVEGIGDNAALDLDWGVGTILTSDSEASIDHAAMVDLACFHMDGSSANILVQSDDNTTDVANVDSTIDNVATDAAASFKDFFIICRPSGSVEFWIDQAQVLSSTTFAIGTSAVVQGFINAEKTSNDTLLEMNIARWRIAGGKPQTFLT